VVAPPHRKCRLPVYRPCAPQARKRPLPPSTQCRRSATTRRSPTAAIRKAAFDHGETELNIENVIWALVPPLSAAVTAWISRLIFGKRGSVRLWAAVAAAAGLAGLVLAPMCLCSDGTDLVVGSSLGATGLGFLASALAYSLIVVISRPKRVCQRRS
jgi:hypothetical protein